MTVESVIHQVNHGLHSRPGPVRSPKSGVLAGTALLALGVAGPAAAAPGDHGNGVGAVIQANGEHSAINGEVRRPGNERDASQPSGDSFGSAVASVGPPPDHCQFRTSGMSSPFALT